MAKKIPKPRVAQPGEEVTIQVPMPEDAVFAHPQFKGDQYAPVMSEKHEIFHLDRVEYPEEGGIHLWLKGLKYPIKGFPYPEALSDDNKAKRILISQIRFFAQNPLACLAFLTNKGRNSWFKEYVMIAHPLMQPHMLKPIRYNPLSRELFKIVPIFLEDIGIDPVQARAMGDIMACMIEHDDGYRYRIEDLMTVTTKEEMLANPAKELEKIVKAVQQRDPRLHMTERFVSIVTLIKFAFWLPGFKKAFLHAISESNFTNMQMDEADRYHTLRYDTYDFGGRRFIDRYFEYLKIHEGNPPQGLKMNN